jgi:amino acid transporter
MIWTLGVGGAVSIFLVFALLVAVPDIGAVISGADAAPIDGILATQFGDVGSKIALAMILFAFVSCTIAIQGASIRLVYSFARDGMIPGARILSRVDPRFHMPPGAVLVATIVPAIITLLPSATVAKIITFAVIGIYIGFQSVVLASIIARRRGWKPSGAFNLGGWGMTVNVLALIYGVSAIVILSIKTPAATDDFLDKWLVPVSAGIVALLGLLWLLIARPKEKIQEEARAEAISMG